MKGLNGIVVPHRKHTAGMQTVSMPVPNHVSLLMAQHIGTPCTPVVAVGDAVCVGQLVGESSTTFSVPVHSSVSGQVTGIHTVLLPNGATAQSVVITSDGLQTTDPTVAAPTVTNHKNLVAAVRTAGLVGLGGAGFPTHIKLNPPNIKDVHTLIVNAAECEPYITSDNRTLLEDTADLLYGIHTVMEYLPLTTCHIVLENNKPQAAAHIREVVANEPRITITELPAIYPQGSEKVMIYHVLDGLIIPEGKLPADVGVIVLNVTTMAKLGRYLQDGMPLTRKRITLDGSAIATPMNVDVPIGTLIADIVAFAGGYQGKPAKLLMGGPMMGLALYSDAFPLLKNNNAIIALSAPEATCYAETSCIACGRCVRACPINLMPLSMKAATEHKAVELLRELKVNLCIECGCCSYVCPARQELVQAHRTGKKLLRNAKI